MPMVLRKSVLRALFGKLATIHERAQALAQHPAHRADLRVVLRRPRIHPPVQGLDAHGRAGLRAVSDGLQQGLPRAQSTRRARKIPAGTPAQGFFCLLSFLPSSFLAVSTGRFPFAFCKGARRRGPSGIFQARRAPPPQRASIRTNSPRRRCQSCARGPRVTRALQACRPRQ